jgi:O-antigen ligase
MDERENRSWGEKVLWCGLLTFIFLLPLVFSPSLYRSFETAKSSFLRVGVALLLLVWSVLRWRRNATCLRPSSALPRTLGLFLLASLGSSLFSLEPMLSIFGTYERQLGLVGLLAATFSCLLLAEALCSGKSKRMLVTVMALSGSIAGLYGLLQYCRLDPFGWSDAFGNRPVSTLGHPDFFGALLSMTLPLALSLCYRAGAWSARLLWILAVVMQLGGLLVSQTRGAWVAASVSLVCFLVAEPCVSRLQGKLFRRKVLTSSLALGVLLCLGVSAFLLKPEFRDRGVSIFHWKEQERIYLWRDTLKAIRENPLLGSGPETFRIAFMPHKSIELARLEKNVNFDNPHNNYLYLWATTGSVGLLTYFYLLFACFREGMRRLRSHDSSPATLYLGVVSSLLAYGVCMLTGFDTIATLGYFCALIAILAAGQSPSERKASGGAGTVSGRYLLVFLCALLFGGVVYDTSRVLGADYLAHKALALDMRLPTSQDQAAALLERACARAPRESYYRLRLAELYLRRAQEAEYKEPLLLRKAVYWGELSLQQGWAPENSFQLMSTAYLRLKACAEAESTSRRGLALDPQNFPLRTTLACALACQGKREEARGEVVRALSIDPTYLPARRLKKSLEGGT